MQKTHGATEFTLAHNVSSKEEVDMVMEQAKEAGAKIIKSAQETFYSPDCKGSLLWRLNLFVAPRVQLRFSPFKQHFRCS